MQRRENDAIDRGRGFKNPTFSSILLDEIYQSMANDEKPELPAVRKIDGFQVCGKLGEEEEEEEKDLALRRACWIEKWMEEKIRDKTTTQREKYPLHFDRNLDSHSLFLCSSSSSSDSSSGGLSSSDNDSSRRAKPWSSSSYELGKHPKPIRTGGSSESDKVAAKERNFDDRRRDVTPKRPSPEDSLIKSESRALKIYNNLKKMKSPATPGGRMAAFINSLFQAGHTRKHDAIASERKKHGDEPVCSSVSSFSRSCLSKNTPASREKLRNKMIRNVSFVRKEADTEHDDEFAWGFLKEYRNRSSNLNAGPRGNGKAKEDDDCDGASCASSDLFELDHLAAVERFRKELPVYETTRLGFRRSLSNRARV